MIGAGRQLVPGRLQSIAEISYEFVANTIRSTAGSEGMKFFPLVFSLFMFIAVSNIVGVIPYNFTIASHLIVTARTARMWINSESVRLDIRPMPPSRMIALWNAMLASEYSVR